MAVVGRARRSRAGVFTAALACAVLLISVPGAHAETRYSLAGGCYTLTSASGQAAPGAGALRMQATRLGSYMLFGPNADFIAAIGGNAVGHALQPGPAADWKVEDAPAGAFTLSPASQPGKLLALIGGNLTLVPAGGGGDVTRFSFSPTSNCAVFPEAELDASGTPSRGATSYGEVKGVVDGHMHWMSFDAFGGAWHCGKPWSPYGIAAALPDCSTVEGPLGATAPSQNFINYGAPVYPHDTTGWPKLSQQGPHNLSTEGTYWRWVERAWLGGLRLIVMPAYDNRLLCLLQSQHTHDCDEMNTVYDELDAIHQLQDYIDAQFGGPGKGFFRIVTNPFEARRVINEGKMAVVLEVETSELFDCTGADPSSCSKAKIEAGLNKLYDKGVRSSLLLNKFDNPLSGVRFDSGGLGAFLNAGNKVSYGSFWNAKSCQGLHDNTIDEGGLPDPTGFIPGAMNQIGVPPGTLPVYPPAPHCNTRGLTDLGAYTVERMMDKGMIVNPDHMSQLAVDKTLSLAEARHYSGVISPHGWMDARNWPRIYNLGGMAFPDSNDASQFVTDWRNLRPQSPPYYLGWGYGADLGGLASQPNPDGPNAISYPFKSLDGSVTFDRQRTGDRVFDYNAEGVAQYGLYPDWLEDVRKRGGNAIAQDMLDGAETYLEMWERAEGIKAYQCLPKRAKLTKNGLGSLRLGLGPDALLRKAGQPLRRSQVWTYCVKGNKGKHSADAVLTPEGSVVLVASHAPGHRARGIGPGAPASLLKGHAKPIGHKVWLAKLGKRRVAYVVRKGKVKTVAVAAKSLGGRNALTHYLKMVPSGGAPQHPKLLPLDRTLTNRNAEPLRLTEAAKQISFVCGLAAHAAPAPASPFSAPL